MVPGIWLVLMQLGVSGASTWVPQPIGTTSDLHAVRAMGWDLAWAAGERGTVARTADGGRTWFASTVYTCSLCRLSALVPLDRESAVLTSGSRPARIYFSGDGGRSWALRWESDQHDVHLAALAFFDANRGFAAGEESGGRLLLIRTTDRGATWYTAERTLPARLPGERISDVSGGAAVAVSKDGAFLATSGGAGGRVFRTLDGGASWLPARTRLLVINALAFTSPTEGIAVGMSRGRGNLARTTDGGASWSEPVVAALPGQWEGASSVPGTRTLVIVGPSGSALSDDGGVSWRVMDRLPSHGVSFAGPTDAGWKVGDEGSVQKLLRGVKLERRAAEATPVPVEIGPSLGRNAAPPTPRPEATAVPMGSRPLKTGTKMEN